MSVTVSFQPTGPVPGNAGPMTMRGSSLTIGRGPSNDMVLPDPDRMLSKSHCVIEDQGGNVVVIDLSTNGTFLNYARHPLGPVPTPLSDGDVLTLGMFELRVSINSDVPSALDLPPDPLDAQVSHGLADRAPDPLDLLDAPGPEGDVLDELLGGGSVPTGPSQLKPVDPIDELLPPDGSDDDDPFFDKPRDGREGKGASFGAHNPSASDSFASQRPSRQIIPDDWDDLLEPKDASGDGDDPFASFEPPRPDADSAPDAEPDHTPTPTPEPAAPRPAEASAPPATAEPPLAADAPTTFPPPPRPEAAPETPAADPASPPPSPASTDATRAFLEALGMDETEIRDEDLPETMARAGAIMRVLVSGIREILMTRTSIKSEFRIEQTMIAAGGNNPLKFSVSPEQAIESLLRPRARGYMGAEEAATQALDDIAAHEVAMVAGMESAIKSVLGKLSPEVLAERLEGSGRIGGLLRGRKAQYWDVYEKMFAEISDQAENDFHHFFSREFARAYQDQLNRLKLKNDP